jgi:Lipase (class 3)
MQHPAGPMGDAIAAALAPGMSLQQAASLVANGVCEAYAAYNNGSNLQPNLGGYHGFNSIWVFEAFPNLSPFSVSEAHARVAAAVSTKRTTRIARRPAAYTSVGGSAAPTCVGPTPIGTPSPGSQLFGFTATADDHSHNILVLRGTVTLEEAGYDLLGWGDNTECLLPSQSEDQQNYGQVNSYLYALYIHDDGGAVTSLAASCLNAIQATSLQAPNLPWYLGAHSLGGPMLSLAAFDAVLSSAFGGINPLVFTFGSLHVGDAPFAGNYMVNVPASIRVANLCDFVPSMVSIEPVTPVDPYTHVGQQATFVWQTWDDWGNHSIANIYLPMVLNHWDVIQWGPRKYPQ